jgi:hypothetical protein
MYIAEYMISRFTVLKILCAAIAFGGCLTLELAGGESMQNTPSAELSAKPVAVNGGEIGEMLRRWYSEGTAAGNIGDYYDNRDGGHSNLNMRPYPQLQRIEYTEEQIKAHQDWGIQKKILPFVVFGNSSTSAPPDQGGSNARGYYVDPDGLKFLFTQYIRNNLYIYPEHQDHDPGNNGIGGYGDLFPTNTPYLIASQGSSGSDQPFMRAMPYVLAAFRPEVKKKLIQSGTLMPTIQMILRITGKQLSTREEYLTGKAHPSAFRGSDLDAKKMVEAAHEITSSTIPPIALLKVVKEDIPVNGVDYFEPEHTEILANTPAVIARIFRGADRERKMTVSAQDSSDPNNRPLEFHWVVLRGDPQRIKIEYLNPAHSIAEITIPYFHRAPIAEGSDLESNRIDIGVFVHNGAYYSPPAFLTFYTLDNEARAYGSDGRPLEIAYDVQSTTISIADWKAFFDALDPQAESWPCKFLRRQFKSREIAGLNGVAEDFYEIHEVLLSARKRQEEAKAAAGTANDGVKALEAGQAAAEKSEKEVLEKEIPNLNRSASALVREVLNSGLQDPDLWITNERELELLYEAAGREARDSYDKIKNTLILYGVGENSGGLLPSLSLIRANEISGDRLTRYEKAMVANLNAVVLSRIVFPGIVNSATREHFVDYRIASVKEWRDVFRYAPDGTPMGWRRYQSGGISEFNAEGLLVLEKDSQNRCIRARLVRYELEPQRKDSRGRLAEHFRRKVRMIPTDMMREYEYEGVDDYRGHIKRRYLAQ